jgi:hypothetical protein
MAGMPNQNKKLSPLSDNAVSFFAFCFFDLLLSRFADCPIANQPRFSVLKTRFSGKT